MAADDQVYIRTARDLLVFAHRQVSQSHDDLSAVFVNRGHHLLRGVARVAKIDVWTRPRSVLRVGQHETEDADLNAAKLANDKRSRAAERFACSHVDYVGGDPAKLRLLYSLLQHVGSKIKLVIAESCVVEAGGVPGFDHLRALISDRFDRRRDGVAGQQEKRVWVLGSDGFLQCQEASKPAARVLIHR